MLRKAQREGSRRRAPVVPSKKSPALFFGRRPPLNQRRATPYVPANPRIPCPRDFMKSQPGNARRRAFPPRFCRLFRKSLRTVPRLKALQITARGVAPCSHATRTDMPVRLSEPRRKITVPLDKGERARKLCSAKRRGKGVAAAALLSRKKIRFNPFPSVQSVFKSPRPPRLRVRILSGELPLFLPFLNLPFPSLTILLIPSLRALRVSA